MSINQNISIVSYPNNTSLDFLCSVEAEIDYYQKKYVYIDIFVNNTILFFVLIRSRTPNEQFDTDMMAKEFLMNFTNHVLSVGQTLLFPLPEKYLMIIKIISIEGKYF